MERTADFQFESTFRTCSKKFFASSVNRLDLTGDHNLAGTIVVGADNDSFNFITDRFNCFIGQSQNSSHCRRLQLTSLLHCLSTGRNQTESIFESQSAGGNKSREFAERVTGHHVRLEFLAERFCKNNRMKENGRLSDFCLLQFLIGHGREVGEVEAADLVVHVGAGLVDMGPQHLLERRLDNVVYRLGFAMSRAEARQLVLHGHFTVNGRKVNIPSYLVKSGDVVALKEGSRSLDKFKGSLEANSSRVVPKWLEMDQNNVAKVIAEPAREDIDLPIEEHLIVELYSK